MANTICTYCSKQQHRHCTCQESPNRVPPRPPPTHQGLAVHNVYELKTQPELVCYLHAAAGFPTKPTWIAVIKNKQYASWPGRNSVGAFLTSTVSVLLFRTVGTSGIHHKFAFLSNHPFMIACQVMMTFVFWES